MALSIGTRLGPYEILSALGAGGMGEVYRARDTRLDRTVAIKVLPEAFAADAERVARFEREAKTLASLNHPHIAAIYGLEDADPSPSSGQAAVKALVMELVDGEDLSQRIARGAIQLDEALPIAKQIAEALEAAHEHGIIHRDLKPANIKVRADGTVKVLDFGLAKAMEPVGTASNVSRSPTITTPAMMTGAGVILGTAAYMAPEQARGKTVDTRADIWAFGCVLYEMLAGRAAFEGDTVNERLANVLKSDPDWARLPAETPADIRRVLRRCLEKDRARRLQHIGDARLEIDEAQSQARSESPSLSAGSRRKERVVWLSALAIVGLIAVVAIVWALRPVPVPPEMRVDINTPPTTDPISIAISPDGHTMVFTATSEGRSQLWLRSLDVVAARALPRTDGAAFPFWSPDNRSVGFFAEGQLKRIDIEGGSVQTLAPAYVANGGSWSRDGAILFAQTSLGPLYRVFATGGAVAAVTRLETPQQTSHSFPHFLPDGQHFLYYVRGTPDARGVWVGMLDGSASHRVLDADSAAVYATASGQLLFVRQGTLLAQPFDAVRATLSGHPFPVAEQVAVLVEPANVAALSASATGPIAYRTGSAGGQRQFVWIDRFGKEIAKVGEPDGAFPQNPSMSPDEHQVAMSRLSGGNADIWLLEIVRGVLRRFTSDTAPDIFPIWSPDGTRIVFSSNRQNNIDLYLKPTTRDGMEEPLLTTSQPKYAMAWSPDGRFILYGNRVKSGYDIWALPLDGSRPGAPFPVVQTDSDERDAQFSPDGKWIAYQSNESGRYEIYVQRFPRSAGPQRISTTGGAQVRWRKAPASARTRFSRWSAPAAWARCIARATRSSIATSR